MSKSHTAYPKFTYRGVDKYRTVNNYRALEANRGALPPSCRSLSLFIALRSGCHLQNGRPDETAPKSSSTFFASSDARRQLAPKTTGADFLKFRIARPLKYCTAVYIGAVVGGA
jgi:hypothetical protein